MAEIIPLKKGQTVDDECANCVALLEELLDEANKGTIRTIVVGYSRPSGTIGTRWSQGDVIPVLASTALLFNRIMGEKNEVLE